MAIQNASPIDMAVAAFADKDLKACAATSARSACECTDPQVRTALAEISQASIQRQAQLSAMMVQKGYYVPAPADDITYRTLMPQLDAIARGVDATVNFTVGGATNTGNNANAGNTASTGGVTAPRLV